MLLKGYFVNRGMILAVSCDAIGTIRAHFQDAANNPLPDDIQNPPIPARATRDCTYVPNAEDKKTFVASPEIFMCEAQKHAETLLAAIQDPDVRRRVRGESHGDAREVIRSIAHIRTELTPAQISNQLARLARHTRQGIQSMSLSAWSRWRTAYDDMAFCLPKTHALPFSYIAQDYRKAVLTLGAEFAMLVATEVKIKQAENCDKLTAAAIHTVIEEQQLTAQHEGRAMQATDRRDSSRAGRGDPRKLPRRPGRGNNFRPSIQSNQSNLHARPNINRPNGNLTWNDGRRLCVNHGKPGCDGKHMDRDCPLAGGARKGRALTAHKTTIEPSANSEEPNNNQIDYFILHA